MSVDSFLASGNSPGARCGVGLLGFGTVGSAIARRLTGDEGVDGLVLTHILDRRAFAKRDALAGAASGRHRPIVWTTRVEDLLASDVDVVVEAIGGLEPAAEWIRAALLAGKSVVTAN